MVPKIADFGISKFFCDQKLETRATSAIGSLGYMAPEYLSGNIVSKMADIYSLGVIIMQIITGRRVDVTSCEDIVEPVLENWSKRMEAKTSITDYEQIRTCLKIGIQCVEFIKEYRPSIKEILQILSMCEGMNNGYTSDKEAYKLMEGNNMRDQESHYNKNGATFEEIVEERILTGGDADDDQNGFPDEDEMPRSVINAKLLVGATEKEQELGEMGAHSDPAPAREETTEEMVARIGGMVPAALDAVRAAAGFPGRWKAIMVNVEKLWVCLPILSSNLRQLESYDNALCREVLQSVADTLATATNIAGRSRAPLTTGKLQLRSSIDALAVKVEVSLRDCELLVKIMGELYDNASSSSPPLDDTTSTGVRELQRLLGWLQMSHKEAKKLALDGVLEALHKDEKSVISMLHDANVSAMVELLNASWPMVVREKAATMVCHVAKSCCKDLLVSEGALVPLIRLAESGSIIGRQKATVALHHLSSTSYNATWVIMSHGGIRPLVEMCRQKSGDYVCQFAAAGTLRNISAVLDFQQDDHGTVRVMVSLLGRNDAMPESKEHAAQCLQNLTAGYNGDELPRAVLSEGALRALLLYLGDNNNPHEAAVNAIRNLVRVISTSGLPAGDTTTMKHLAGEEGCVPLLVRTMLEHNSDSAREVAVQALASLATYPPNAREMNKDDKCVAGLVRLLDPSRYNTTTNEYAIQCLLSLASTNKRCRKLMISHGVKGHLKKLIDMNVQGATELLQRLEGSMLRSLFSSSKQ